MRNASKLARYMMLRPSENENRNENRGGNSARNEYEGGMQTNRGRESEGKYEAEMRYRDQRGRERYDNGRYAPRNEYDAEMRGEGGMQNEMRSAGGVENRRGQRRGRDGRYRAEEGGGMRNAYEEEEEYRMNTIGFGNRDYPEPMQQQGGARIENGGTREMESRSGMKEHGGAYSEDMELTLEVAKEWTSKMKNGDGTTGAHWSMEQAKQLMQQRNVSADPIEFFAVINAVYSDYYTVAKKHNAHNIDFYIDMAKAWLEDKDAVPNKAAAYYECVVKH